MTTNDDKPMARPGGAGAARDRRIGRLGGPIRTHRRGESREKGDFWTRPLENSYIGAYSHCPFLNLTDTE